MAGLSIAAASTKFLPHPSLIVRSKSNATWTIFLRLRLKEPGMSIRFGGNDTVDLKQVEWVELIDSQERKFRLAVDSSTHLLVRSSVTTKDEETQQYNEDVSIYSNYQLKTASGPAANFITRTQRPVVPCNFSTKTCRYNPGFSNDIFEKSSLNKQAAQALAKKNKN